MNLRVSSAMIETFITWVSKNYEEKEALSAAKWNSFKVHYQGDNLRKVTEVLIRSQCRLI